MSQESSQPPSFLDPGSEHIPISTWADIATSPENLALSKSSTIVQIKYLKKTVHVNHEALELKIHVGGNPGRIAWLFVERAGAARPSWSPASSSSSLTTSIDKASQSGNLSSSFPAEDRILVTAASRVSDRVYDTIMTLNLPETSNFRVVDAVALLVTVSSSDQIYKLFKSNCYWFAQGVYNAIEERYGGTTIQGGSRMKPGHFGRVEITSTDSNVSTKALLATKNAWQDKIQAYACLMTREEISAKDQESGRRSEEVRHEVTKEQAKREAEARARAEEQARKDAEAKARAEEQAKREAEARARAEEAEARAEEAKARAEEAKARAEEAKARVEEAMAKTKEQAEKDAQSAAEEIHALHQKIAALSLSQPAASSSISSHT